MKLIYEGPSTQVESQMQKENATFAYIIEFQVKNKWSNGEKSESYVLSWYGPAVAASAAAAAATAGSYNNETILLRNSEPKMYQCILFIFYVNDFRSFCVRWLFVRRKFHPYVTQEKGMTIIIIIIFLVVVEEAIPIQLC